MKASDPKQVAVLSVVAVGAIGFLGYTLFGGGKPSKPMRLVREAEAETPGGTADKLPAEMVGDPFFHPKLVKLEEEASTKPVEHPAGQTEPSKSASPNVPRLPPMQGTLPVSPFGVRYTVAPPQPAEDTGTNRKEERAGLRIALTAIVKVDQSMALLSLGGKDTQTFRVGQTLGEDIRLVAIGEDSITVATKGGKRRIRIGEEAEL